MPKGLRLKKTPAEQVERDMRRARRAVKRAHRQYRAHDVDLDSGGRSSKRSGTEEDKGVGQKSPSLDPGPSTSHCDARTDPVEGGSFQEKLWDALRDDERLDGIEAGLNEYAYIPRRWRGVSSRDSPDTVGGLGDDPNLMNDDEYAEWMRTGMWRCVLTDVQAAKRSLKTLDRRSNAAAHREKERQRAAHVAAKAEAAKILKAEEDARRRARYERERVRHANARDAYERHWAGLLGSKSNSADLGFGDIPWPVHSDSQITAEAISSFLFLPGDEGHDEAGRGRTRKEELRGTILRFHPDKFEGRVIPRVKDEERVAVREGANAVTRAVTALMGGKIGDE